MHFAYNLSIVVVKDALLIFNGKNLIMNRLKHFINIDDLWNIGNGKYQIIYPVMMILKI